MNAGHTVHIRRCLGHRPSRVDPVQGQQHPSRNTQTRSLVIFMTKEALQAFSPQSTPSAR
jgi:hypothetical protein